MVMLVTKAVIKCTYVFTAHACYFSNFSQKWIF